MIDIVFQLLIFFIMLFKIVLPEGDFNVRMPTPASNPETPPSETPTLVLRMTAGEEGVLTSMKLGDRAFTDEGRTSAFDKLRGYIIGRVEDEGGPGTASDQEVELECDYDLDYQYVIQAITAISGYIKDGQRYKLIERIRFAPPKQQ
ncbi:MAG: biopolymer transporter ExbD, partial [Aeoliella sp.]